ncbi:hypothetical protein U9M48_001433 [Paspalum notatum var. saurae]|uniref:SWIM-type domain-containing protein n=1 Tax=Paspalum notatum var. saurae TaxID=547442 RepID=A0AAQ3SGP4_PASNO
MTSKDDNGDLDLNKGDTDGFTYNISEVGGCSNEGPKGAFLRYNNGDVAEIVESVYYRDLFDNMQIEALHLGGMVSTCEPDASDAELNKNDGDEVLTEEQIEDFIRSEQIAASEGNNASLDSKYTPQVGMEFKTKEDAQHFLCFYGFLACFKPVITHNYRTTSKKRNNEITKLFLKCDRHGKTKEEDTSEPVAENTSTCQKDGGKKQKRNTNVQVKTGCPVSMVIKEKGSVWVIATLDLDHNHELNPEDSNNLFSGHKYMTEMEKGVIRTLNANNIPTRKMIGIFSYLRGGMTALPYKKKDVGNYRTKINREVTGNDMTQALHFFQDKQKEDPNFFYRFIIGEDKKVKHMFWADGSAVRYYEQYGDCVSFDTTYMTNKYNLPFAPFVGVTGHGHTCMFACAFLSDETSKTVQWIFETFLEAMGGKHPRTIITDQDKAMRSAIAKIFHNTVHRNCFFHIKNKCYQKNGNCFARNRGMPGDFEDIVNNSLTVPEFERDWRKMVEDYKLENNKYFNKMWETRHRFIPVYFKNDFFPFLQSMGRSEGTNSRFKDNVGPTYSVISFLHEYQRIVEQVNVAEKFEDHESRRKRLKELMFGYTIERQAQEVYNRNIFRRFQNQLKATPMLSYTTIDEHGVFEVYQKTNQEKKPHKTRRYIVVAKLTDELEALTCVCGKFDKDGILCSHVLKVLIEEGVTKIPECYIKERWRKKEFEVGAPPKERAQANNPIIMHNLLSRKAAVLTSAAAKTEETMQFVCEEIDRLQERVTQMLTSKASQISIGGESSAVTGSGEVPDELGNPEAVK